MRNESPRRFATPVARHPATPTRSEMSLCTASPSSLSRNEKFSHAQHDSSRALECDIPTTFTSLPNGVQALPAMEEALQAANFASTLERSRFARAWYSSPSQDVAVKFVWYAILTHFKPDEAALARLVPQLATSYARLISGIALSAEARDTLIWYFPEVLVHTTTCVLSQAFPRLQSVIDDRMHESLFSTFVAQTGFPGHRHLLSTNEQCSGTTSPSTPRHGKLGDAQTPRGSIGVQQRLRTPLAQLLGATDGTAISGGGIRTSQFSKSMEPACSSPRKSCVVGALPPARREWKDMSACSPLMERWIELRQAQRSTARGAASGNETHRVRCSSMTHRYNEEKRLIEAGAHTYRDLTRESAKRMERLTAEYNKNCSEALHEATLSRFNFARQVSALLRDRQRALDRGQSREWANYLVSLRRLDDDQYCRELAALAG
ncbi:hypothetical protein AB1Y20_002654 [Prymnesium parvum]|uniref:Uncharacterized protein n=1 Tax=Prymnesium parvum TaxID=97485 RepID=A0AB34J9P2_PRYPA